MRVLVCGGRDFDGFEAAFQIGMTLGTIHAEHPITVIIHGAARGADACAASWARWTGIPQHAFPANWADDGPSAGPLRNQRMLDEGRPDLVVAFPGGRGTADMVRRAEKAGVRVISVGARS